MLCGLRLAGLPISPPLAAEPVGRRKVSLTARVLPRGARGRRSAVSRNTPVGGSSSVARRADRRAAVDMSTATTTAACTRARAARAHHTLKLGPRIYGPRRCLYLCPGGLCFPDPTSAGGSFPPSRAGGFLRRERPVVEERRRARAACDLEGNRAGLGCLEHLGNALSFAVVTEWPVRVYPRHRCRSPPQACLV